MSKKSTTRRHSTARQTNWVLIGGILVGGVLILGALLILSTQGSDIPTLDAYCEENPDSCFTLGDSDAPVTIVEVADFGCSHCRDFHVETFPSIEAEYISNGDVQFVMLPYALGDVTIPAANAAMCAGEQGQYFPFAAAMYANYDDPTIRTSVGFTRIGSELGLDMDAFGQCVSEGRHTSTIRDNINIASRNGVSSTPTFFINDSRLNGAFPLSTFQQRIDALLGS